MRRGWLAARLASPGGWRAAAQGGRGAFRFSAGTARSSTATGCCGPATWWSRHPRRRRLRPARAARRVRCARPPEGRDRRTETCRYDLPHLRGTIDDGRARHADPSPRPAHRRRRPAVPGRPARAARTPGPADLRPVELSAQLLSPGSNTGTAAGTVKLLIYRGLTSYDADGAAARRTGRDLERDGDDAWVLQAARRDASTTAPVTAADVKWTIEQIAAEKSTAYHAQRSSRASNASRRRMPRTVRLVMKQPNGDAAALARRPTTCRSWRHGLGRRRQAAGRRRPVHAEGAGARRLDRARGLRQFYKPGLPKLKRIAHRRLCRREPARRRAAVRRCRHDRIRALAVDGGDRGRSEAEARRRRRPVHGPDLQRHQPPFNDPRVRQAVAHADQARRDRQGRVLRPRHAARGHADRRRAALLRRRAGRRLELRSRPAPRRCWPRPAVPTASPARCSRPRSTACTRTPPRWCSSIWPRSASRPSCTLPDWSTRVALGNRGQYDIAIHGIVGRQQRSRRADRRCSTARCRRRMARSFELEDAAITAAAGAPAAPSSTRPSAWRSTREMQRARWRRRRSSASPGARRATPWTRACKGFTNLPGALTFYLRHARSRRRASA